MKARRVPLNLKKRARRRANHKQGNTLNFHPQTVHFPIALLIVAGGLYLYAFYKNESFSLQAAILLHTLGVLGMVVAIISGKIAQSTITTTDSLRPILRNHELFAYGNIWVFGILWIWQYTRIKSLKRSETRSEKLFFSLLFMLAIGFMAYGSHLGGKMVYEQGAGVKPIEQNLKGVPTQDSTFDKVP